MDEKLGRLLVISPHLGEGTFSCGELLAAHFNSVVITVFAGIPHDTEMLTEWDKACGFSDAREAITVRRIEDSVALRILGARPHWLDFCDSQYKEFVRAPAIAEHLLAAIDRYTPDTFIIPMGLFHNDHLLTHEGALLACHDHSKFRILAYEDVMYRKMPGLLQQRLISLANINIQATPWQKATVGASSNTTLKKQAFECYGSQQRCLITHGRPDYEDVYAPERYWQLIKV
jgi:LmbE family N-acetylglucosaminyl deacetylase